MRRLLDAEEFAFIDRAAVTRALNGYEGGGADFSDYLIGASTVRAGVATTYTFDRALRRAGGFSARVASKTVDLPCSRCVCH